MKGKPTAAPSSFIPFLRRRADEVDAAFGGGDTAFAFEGDGEGWGSDGGRQAVGHARAPFGVRFEGAAGQRLLVGDEPELVCVPFGAGRKSRGHDDGAPRGAVVGEHGVRTRRGLLARQLGDAHAGRSQKVVHVTRARELFALPGQLGLRRAQAAVEARHLRAERPIPSPERERRRAEQDERQHGRRRAEAERGPPRQELPQAEAAEDSARVTHAGASRDTFARLRRVNGLRGGNDFRRVYENFRGVNGAYALEYVRAQVGRRRDRRDRVDERGGGVRHLAQLLAALGARRQVLKQRGALALFERAYGF